jgi:hypothetical protein
MTTDDANSEQRRIDFQKIIADSRGYPSEPPPSDFCPICGSCWSYSHKTGTYFCDGARADKIHDPIGTNGEKLRRLENTYDDKMFHVEQCDDTKDDTERKKTLAMCANCYHWEPRLAGSSTGRCTATPPAIIVVGGNVLSAWPNTQHDDQCGWFTDHHQEKKDDETQHSE